MTAPSPSAVPSRRRSKLALRLLLAVVATLLALLLGEAVCRIWAPPMVGRGRFFTQNGLEVPLGEIIAFLTRMPEADSRHNLLQEKPHGMMLANLKLRMGYTPPPRWDYFDANGCVPVDTNSLGLRDEEFAAAKATGEFRVLALGDSMTYGQGVRLDLTWPQVLERSLNKELGRPVEVINAGFAAGPGVSSPDGYDRWFADNGILFAPDVVVVGICLNDLGPIPMLTYPVVPLEPVWGGFSRLLDRSAQFVRQRQVRAQRRDLLPLVQQQPAAWQGTQRGLLALRDTCQQAGIALLVVILPMMSQLEPELYPCRGLHALVADFCGEHGIASSDLLEAFLGRSEHELWVHPSDQHPNHLGHRLIAEAVHASLHNLQLLPGR
jgi:lysophospholipase L1-like esterase